MKKYASHGRTRYPRRPAQPAPPKRRLVTVPMQAALFVLLVLFVLTVFPSRGGWGSPWRPVGEADRTGSLSWSHVEDGWLEGVLADPGWQPIVQDSPFRLGERRLIPETEDRARHELRSWGSYPRIDGSTVAQAMVVEFARQHLDLERGEIWGFTSLSTTHRAFERLIAAEPDEWGVVDRVRALTVWYDPHPVDLVIGTAPSGEELQLAADAGVTLVMEPVCRDAFVFITHRDNPLESLTLEQLRGIYSGEITDWSEVGGPAGPIQAFQREPNSGSQTAMEQLVMGGTAMRSAPRVTATWGMGNLVSAVAEYRNEVYSLGYTYRYYIDMLYRDEEIKLLAVEGVPPTDENILSGAYPLGVYYYGVIRDGEQDGPGGLFLHWMRSDEGQACIAQAGYLTLEG